MSKEKKSDFPSIDPKKLKKHLTKRNVAIGVIALLFLVQYIQIQVLLGNFSFLQGRDSSLVTEIGELRETYAQIGTDLNEVREFLRLPTSSYNSEEEISGEENDGKNTDEIQLALFKYVDFLVASKTTEEGLKKNKGYLEQLSADEAFNSFLEGRDLKISKIGEDPNGFFATISKENLKIASFYLQKESGKMFLKTVTSKDEVVVKSAEELAKDVKKFISDKQSKIEKATVSINEKKKMIAEAIESKEVKTKLEELKLSLNVNPVEENFNLKYSIEKLTGDVAGEIVLDTAKMKIILVDKNDPSVKMEVSDVKKSLLSFLPKLETKTFIEKKVEEAREKVEKTIGDKGFKLLLSQAGFQITEKSREDEDRIYYDILDKEGKKLSSIVIEKATGVINIVQPDGTNSENLLFFDQDTKKKTLDLPANVPDYGSEVLSSDNTFNILIAGKHGSLIDTMIFAHINEDTREIRMISIPRDLFYKGRKINAYAHFYGMPELAKVLSDITGYKLDKYILIDMYAFIDVIDLLGGIDIHLNSPVIDPTYRTVDNGKEGTLHYEPGDYHLGGKESLRLARTRHTSSDFARAERQQLILEALQDKARNFGFGDADTIYELAKVVLAKTESDINIDEALAYYFRYQNFKIVSNNVMSSGNVLYVPPYITKENCAKAIAEAAAAKKEKPGCENENQAYTLSPRNNNWNIVKWFFRENFEGV